MDVYSLPGIDDICCSLDIDASLSSLDWWSGCWQIAAVECDHKKIWFCVSRRAICVYGHSFWPLRGMMDRLLKGLI